jgi:hypothetical protein
MSQPKESVNMDVMGRVMFLEQRTKGLQGRLSAIEMRLSGNGGHDFSPGPAEDTEFIPAAGLSNLPPGTGTTDHRPPAIERSMAVDPVHQQRAVPKALDMTGIVAGLILIGAGLLLYTGNIDLIKNPLLSLGCGIFFILFSVIRSALYKQHNKDNEVNN